MKLQGAILGKALNYDRSIDGDSANVLIIASSSSNRGADELEVAFSKLGSNVRRSDPESVDVAAAKWADAAYVFAGRLTVQIRELCTTYRMLSMSASVSEVLAGRASVAVGSNNSKPQLVINLTRVQAEGHRLSSRLLKLARVVR